MTDEKLRKGRRKVDGRTNNQTDSPKSRVGMQAARQTTINRQTSDGRIDYTPNYQFQCYLSLIGIDRQAEREQWKEVQAVCESISLKQTGKQVGTHAYELTGWLASFILTPKREAAIRISMNGSCQVCIQTEDANSKE